MHQRREFDFALGSSIAIFLLLAFSKAQMLGGSSSAGGLQGVSPQVKISARPFPVSNTQHMGQIVLTMLGRTTREQIFCVSEAPVSQLRFICVDCQQKNVTDMANFLNSAQDVTRTAGFPTVELPNVEANASWTGVTVICQAAINGGTVDSPPSTVDVRFLRQPHVVDHNVQGPVYIQNQGFQFYVECSRGPDGQCQQTGRRKTLHCAVQAHPPANTFRWLKNGAVISSNSQEITIGTEMIGHSIQCSANNGLYGDVDMPTSQAVHIHAYTAAHVVQDNFQQIQSNPPFQSGNRIEMNQRVSLSCTVEGSPKPVVFWRLRRTNGQVVDAPCPQGLNGQYRESPINGVPGASLGQALIQSSSPSIRLNAICDLQIANYSFSGQYWCSACSYISQGDPECSPSKDTPNDRLLNLQVQGQPMQAEVEPSVEQLEGENTANVLVHYCAEPIPRLPREILFSVDNNEIPLGQRWQNFHFESTTQNNTVPNCYFARLRISPVHEDDQARKIVLKVQNQFGSKHISVPLADLLGYGASDIGWMPNWLAVILAIIAFVVVLGLVIFVCMRLNLCDCFQKAKDGQTHFSTDKPPKISVHDTSFPDVDRTRGGYFNAFSGSNGSNGSGSANERKPAHFASRESLNYAEMQLTTTDRTPVVFFAQPMAVSDQPSFTTSGSKRPRISNV